MGDEGDKSFWVTLPGILTGIAAIITAIGGILFTLHAIGYFDADNPPQVTQTSVTPTPESTPTPTPEPTPEPTPTPTLPSTQAKINITYPLDSTDVQMQETVKGTATNIPEGQQLWIVIKQQSLLEYRPQNYVNIQSDGSWELPVQIGEGDSHGSWFDIYAVLADKNAQNEFNNYLNTFEKTGIWPEMMELPDGSKVKVKVSVGRV